MTKKAVLFSVCFSCYILPELQSMKFRSVKFYLNLNQKNNLFCCFFGWSSLRKLWFCSFPSIVNRSPSKFCPPPSPNQKSKSDCEDFFPFFGLHLRDLWFAPPPQSKILATPMLFACLILAI